MKNFHRMVISPHLVMWWANLNPFTFLDWSDWWPWALELDFSKRFMNCMHIMLLEMFSNCHNLLLEIFFFWRGKKNLNYMQLKQKWCQISNVINQQVISEPSLFKNQSDFFKTLYDSTAGFFWVLRKYKFEVKHIWLHKGEKIEDMVQYCSLCSTPAIL